jgi:hypothetical protein
LYGVNLLGGSKKKVTLFVISDKTASSRRKIARLISENHGIADAFRYCQVRKFSRKPLDQE